MIWSILFVYDILSATLMYEILEHLPYFTLSTVWSYSVSKTHHENLLYNFDPFYIVKLGLTGVYIIFLISAKNTDCGYS